MGRSHDCWRQTKRTRGIPEAGSKNMLKSNGALLLDGLWPKPLGFLLQLFHRHGLGDPQLELVVGERMVHRELLHCQAYAIFIKQAIDIDC
jgi:hypothetical protein